MIFAEVSMSFVVPGHHEPIAAWSVERLQSAREDYAFDLDNGFLPEDAVREVLAEIDGELGRRARGEEAAPNHSAAGRALETWFGREEVTVPRLRGAALENSRGAERQGQTFEGERAAQAEIAPETALERDAGLEP